jgi:inner membrane protein
MSSLFGHAVASVALGKAFSAEKLSLSFWLLTIYCSVLPDSDVISFYFGIQYGNLLGHRGISHSILFAAIIGFAVAYFFFRDVPRYSPRWWRYASFFFLVMVSHGLANALSNGGLGVAFFAPFCNHRYFFSWRPLEVSPIGGLTYFFSRQGWVIIKSEFIWIWLPSIAAVLVSYGVRKFMHSARKIDVPRNTL